MENRKIFFIHPEVLENVHLVSKEDYVFMEYRSISEYPNIKNVVVHMMKEFGWGVNIELKGRVKSEYTMFRQFRTFVCNMMFSVYKGMVWIKYSRDNNFYPKLNSRNTWVSKNNMETITECLTGYGYVKNLPGYYDHDKYYGLCSCFIPTKKFVSLCLGNEIPFDTLENIISKGKEEYPPVVVREEVQKKKKKEKKDIKLSLSDKPNRFLELEKNVERVNDKLENYDIRLDISEEERKEIFCLLGYIPELKEVNYRRIYLGSKGSFTELTLNGGRWYDDSGFQQIPSRFRKNIVIDDEKTVELDFSAIHPTLLYCKEGLSVPRGDLYDIGIPFDKFDKFDVGRDDVRGIIKWVVMKILNSKSPKNFEESCVKRMNEEYELNELQERLFDYHFFRDVKEQIFEKHKKISHYFFRDTKEKKSKNKKVVEKETWGLLQNLDSDICRKVMTGMLNSKRCCLSVHDSFVCKEIDKEHLRKIMIESFQKVMETKHIPKIDEKKEEKGDKRLQKKKKKKSFQEEIVEEFF